MSAPAAETTMADVPPAENTVKIMENEQDVTDPVLQWLEGSSDGPVGLLKSQAVQKPVLLPLSGLIPRGFGVQRPSTRVVALSPSVFQHPIRRDILHACVVHHLDGLRQGTASTKTRAEVSGSGRKIRQQKGTGKARLGDRGSPMLKGGGVAFGPKPRDFSTKLPRKVREMGMRVALSTKLREGNLNIVESLDWPDMKTNTLDKRVKSLGWNDKTLFVVGGLEIPEGLERSAQNLRKVDVMRAEDLSVYEILRWKRMVLDFSAVDFFEQTLGKEEVDDLSASLESISFAPSAATASAP
ncbi:hypothetical protein BOTBODRAFT_45522 [Botryobasidium botryosum FD-172 SS1]|uniref:Large ribosomal subunit protein uL4m n=1 Tax=Botryobasidium botryosum (strain FD-172 SS1) TaxID=930990 RepID=A0A067MMT8_BOTB1|nr:hypothetical protein BOTBODRAFT_45522 [Botryobasidium botryosum FD-172 SS1]